MVNRKGAVLVGLLALAVLAAPGCVSKKLFRGNIEDTDSRVVAVEGAIEANEKRINDLKSDTDRKISNLEGQTSKAMQLGNRAMGKAESAATAAQGKLLWTVTLSNDAVKFEFGQTGLSSSGISALEGLVGKIKAYGKAVYLEIEGHTDSIGPESLNYELGERRAEIVRSYLNQQGGIPLHAMSTISYGESRPVADNSSGGGRAQNRRVVVRVLE